MKTTFAIVAVILLSVCKSPASEGDGNPPPWTQDYSGSIVDPAGNELSPGSDIWFYWAGFGVGLGFFGIGYAITLAKRAGNVTDY